MLGLASIVDVRLVPCVRGNGRRGAEHVVRFGRLGCDGCEWRRVWSVRGRQEQHELSGGIRSVHRARRIRQRHLCRGGCCSAWRNGGGLVERSSTGTDGGAVHCRGGQLHLYRKPPGGEGSCSSHRASGWGRVLKTHSAKRYPSCTGGIGSRRTAAGRTGSGFLGGGFLGGGGSLGGLSRYGVERTAHGRHRHPARASRGGCRRRADSLELGPRANQYRSSPRNGDPVRLGGPDGPGTQDRK